MNYAAHYDRLIARARGRMLDGYRERHHVVPRCMGGLDAPDNIVVLTAKEHYVAHQLLVKIHPSHAGLAHAAVMMSQRCNTGMTYAWLVAKTRGTPKSTEHRIKISTAHRGKKKPRSPEWQAKITASLKGKALSPEHRAKISIANKGKRHGRRGYRHTADALERMSVSQRGNQKFLGKHHLPSTIEKMSAARCVFWQRKRMACV